jgi:hypothetical protein
MYCYRFRESLGTCFRHRRHRHGSGDALRCTSRSRGAWERSHQQPRNGSKMFKAWRIHQPSCLVGFSHCLPTSTVHLRVLFTRQLWHLFQRTCFILFKCLWSLCWFNIDSILFNMNHNWWHQPVPECRVPKARGLALAAESSHKNGGTLNWAGS